MLDNLKQQWQQVGEVGKPVPGLLASPSSSDLQKRLQTLFMFEGAGYPHLVLSLIAFAVAGMGLWKGQAAPEALLASKWSAFVLGGFAVGLVFLYRFWVFRRYQDRPEQSLREYVHGAIMRLKVIRHSQYAFALIFTGLLFFRVLAGESHPLEGLDTRSLIGVGAFALFCIFILGLVFWFQKHQLGASPQDLLHELQLLEKDLKEAEKDVSQ